MPKAARSIPRQKFPQRNHKSESRVCGRRRLSGITLLCLDGISTVDTLCTPAPSSSQAQDIGFSVQEQGFESPWGHFSESRFFVSRIFLWGLLVILTTPSLCDGTIPPVHPFWR